MPRIKMSEKLNHASKMSSVNKDEYIEMFLDADKLRPSEKNSYPIENIEELADNMLLVGHLEPLLVGRVNGEDNIISGHRRYQAIRLNIERGHDEFKKVRCLVKEMPETMFMLTLISGNAFTRVLDDATLVQQAKDYKMWLSAAVEAGDVKVEGPLRDYVAKALGVSSTKMAQVDKINSSLCDEGMEALNAGKINFSKAYEASKLPEETQRKVIQDTRLLSKDVKEMAQAYQQEEKEKKVRVRFEDDSGADKLEVRIRPADAARTAKEDTARRLLEKYKNWEYWFNEYRLGVTYYIYSLPDGRDILAAEYHSMPDYVNYYLLENDKGVSPFPADPDRLVRELAVKGLVSDDDLVLCE